MWNYAELSSKAKIAGSPDLLMKNTLEQGISQGLLISGVLELANLGLGAFLNHRLKKSQEANRRKYEADLRRIEEDHRRCMREINERYGLNTANCTQTCNGHCEDCRKRHNDSCSYEDAILD